MLVSRRSKWDHDAVQADWTEQFQGTRTLPRPVRDRLLSSARLVRAARGEILFRPGRTPDGLLLLVSGRIRVSQTSENGREIVLYRVEAGESCVMTTACMLAEEAYAAEGVAESDIIAVTLPKSEFERLADEEPAFRRFVFNAYSKRLIDLLRVVDDVAFGRMDVRLAQRLMTLAGAGDTIEATHQQLAVELGTAREVITRILQDFHKRDLIESSRGKVMITHRAGLARLAASA